MSYFFVPHKRLYVANWQRLTLTRGERKRCIHEWQRLTLTRGALRSDQFGVPEVPLNAYKRGAGGSPPENRTLEIGHIWV